MKKVINGLKSAKFDFGFFDTWDTGALFIFHATRIKNVFGINNTQLNAYQFKYGGKEYPEEVPEVPTTESLYKEIKAIFINGHQLFDFPLGENKPENVFYVGGIHLDFVPSIEAELMGRAFKKEDIIRNKVILSVENCRGLLKTTIVDNDGKRKSLLTTFLDAFFRLEFDNEHLDFIYDCDLSNEFELILEETSKKWRIEDFKRDFHIFIKSYKITNMQRELANGTIILITNCNGQQVIEAIAAKVQFLCLPYKDDQFYISEALKIPSQMKFNDYGGDSSTGDDVPRPYLEMFGHVPKNAKQITHIMSFNKIANDAKDFFDTTYISANTFGEGTSSTFVSPNIEVEDEEMTEDEEITEVEDITKVEYEEMTEDDEEMTSIQPKGKKLIIHWCPLKD
uniref:Uncharacterized protein n=1 Tax=Meloidogyne hapla TaxID=6305 RepID=A0A1I8BGJ7_MELHA